VIDGDYGPFTRMAVRRLQAANWLVEDGEAGPCTQNVAFGRRGPRADPASRRADSAARGRAVLGRRRGDDHALHVPAVVARTPAELVAEDGGLRTFADTDEAMTADALFASAHGTVLRGAGDGLDGLRACAPRCRTGC
jgi:peptidoglycan hydrolase-like protein with peptidoglycan-binding domain